MPPSASIANGLSSMSLIPSGSSGFRLSMSLSVLKSLASSSIVRLAEQNSVPSLKDCHNVLEGKMFLSRRVVETERLPLRVS